MIRELNHDDLPQLLALGRELHQLGVYASYPVDESRSAYILTQLIDEPSVLTIGYEIDGALAGAFIGEIIQDLWVDVQIAVNQMVYVFDRHRSSLAGMRLIRAFTDWAHAQNADMISFRIYAGVNNAAVGDMLVRMGYAEEGGIYTRNLLHG